MKFFFTSEVDYLVAEFCPVSYHLPLSTPIWKPHLLPSPSLRQCGFLSQVAFPKKRRIPWPAPPSRRQRPTKSRTLPHTGLTLRRVGPGRTTWPRRAKKADTGATSAKSPKKPGQNPI